MVVILGVATHVNHGIDGPGTPNDFSTPPPRFLQSKLATKVLQPQPIVCHCKLHFYLVCQKIKVCFHSKSLKWDILGRTQCLKTTQFFLAILNNFCPIISDLSGNTVWPQTSGQKWPIFGNFYELLSIQDVNVARFVRNIECDFFCDFQTLWLCKNKCCSLKDLENFLYPLIFIDISGQILRGHVTL